LVWLCERNIAQIILHFLFGVESLIDGVAHELEVIADDSKVALLIYGFIMGSIKKLLELYENGELWDGMEDAFRGLSKDH